MNISNVMIVSNSRLSETSPDSENCALECLTSSAEFAEARAQPAASTASFQPNLPQHPPPRESPSQPPGHHRAQKSTEEIMRIFDQPSRQEATFSSMPAEGGHSFFPPPFMQHDASAFPQGLNGGMPANSWPAFKMPQVRISLASNFNGNRVGTLLCILQVAYWPYC